MGELKPEVSAIGATRLITGFYTAVSVIFISLPLLMNSFCCSTQAPDYYNSHYPARPVSYEPIHQGVAVGYPYTGRDYFSYSRPLNFYDSPDAHARGVLLPQRRSPFVPADLHDEKVCVFL